MSTIRGRAIKVGGVALQPEGAMGRQDANQVVRPAFKISAGIKQPTGIGGMGAAAGLLDLSGVSAWRLIAFGLALAYVVGFHVTAGKLRLGIGPGK